MEQPTRKSALPRLGDDGAQLPPYATAEQVLRHPRFVLARNHYMQVITESRYADPTIRRLMHEIARVVLFNIILGHHARQNPDDPSTWPSVGMLRDFFLPFGLASSRSFDQMLARMRAIGIVRLVPAPGDRRRRLVVPTDRMIEEDLTWLAQHMSPLAVLFPERDDYRPALERDRAHQVAQRIVSTRNYAGARDTLSPENPVMALLLRQDASKIVFTYLLAAWDGPEANRASVAYEAVAARLTTSRTHVRNLLMDLQRLEMVRLHDRGGRDVEIMPALWSVVDWYLANAMSAHDLIWQVARQMLDQQAEIA